MINREEVQKIYDSWPEEEPLLPFDGFFAGGAMSPPPTDTAAYSRQISGVNKSKDLTDPVEDPMIVQTRNDLSQFAQTAVEILTDEQYEQLFFASKRAAYQMFDFLSIKSILKGDVPLSERDLILEDEDFYIMEYLRGSTTDYFRVQQMATLMAYRDMGIEIVRFQRRDSCPVCRAYDGLFYNVSYLLDLLGGGSDLTHPSCDISWFPAVYRESYVGPLLGALDIPEVVHAGRTLKNVPRELLHEIIDVTGDVPFAIIDFVNMADYSINEAVGLSDSVGVVVYCCGKMVVHNSYVGMRGPVQFIKSYLTSQLAPEKIDLGPEPGAIFFIKGRAAVKRDGLYWDATTGERI